MMDSPMNISMFKDDNKGMKLTMSFHIAIYEVVQTLLQCTYSCNMLKLCKWITDLILQFHILLLYMVIGQQ